MIPGEFAAIDRAPQLPFNRRRARADVRRIRGGLQVQSNADDDRLTGRADRDTFSQDARELALADNQIIGPLQIGHQPGHRRHAVSNRDPCGQGQQR